MYPKFGNQPTIAFILGHGRVPANMYDENYALLRATGALASLQTFGFRAFCA